MRLDPLAALKRRAERKRATALAKERGRVCDLLNENYGGDWHHESKDGLYRDAMTTRTVEDCGSVVGGRA